MKRGLLVLIILIFTLSQTVVGELVNPITENFIQLSDVTTNNSSASKHGFLPKLDNTGTKYLRDDGTWQTVTGGGSTNMALNTFTGNGVSTTYTLSSNPSVEENTFVYLGGVYQNKSTYSVSGTSLIFSVAPAASATIEVMVGTVSGTSGGGEVNTASNVGAGVGLFAQKSGFDLQFKSVSSTTNSIVLSSDASNAYVDLPTNYLTYTKVLTSVSGSTIVTYADVSQLDSPALPSGLYQIALTGDFATSATTTGIGLRLAAGTATIDNMKILWQFEQAASGTDSLYQYSQKLTTNDTASTGVVVANSRYLLNGFGFFNLSASGTVKIQMRSEIGASRAELYPNTNYVLRRIQ